jgi:2-dehydropantoate 2-reductase
MRILVVGAGALGGFYGAHLARAGRDVTFMVRRGRADQLSRGGLEVVGPDGGFAVSPKIALAKDVTTAFDLILLALKSYSLAEASDQFAKAVGSGTSILPVINGMAHIETLANRFGADRVLGGMAMVSATLDSDGRVVQLLPNNELVFGELLGGTSERIAAISNTFEGAGFNARASATVMQEMWEKWTLLSTNAGATCLMRASIGDILAAPEGDEIILRLFRECSAVAETAGFKPRPPFVEFCMTLLTQAGSPLKASLLRDIERGAPTEGDHVLGDMVKRARKLGVDTPILDLARANVAAYEIGRARTLQQQAQDKEARA